MLDLHKLLTQITALGTYQQNRAHDLATALSAAKGQAKLVSEDISAFARKIKNAITSWLVAIPTDEDPFVARPPAEHPTSYIVLSTDGSQVNPDRHGPHRALLINIGQVEIGYGDFLGYRFSSEPTLFFEEKDIIRRFGGDEREVAGAVLAALRQKMEADALSSMISTCGKTPAVALVDGTLILWSLETNPERLQNLSEDDLKRLSFTSLMRLLEGGKEHGTPVAGYISSPGSSDVVNALKVSLCPSEPVDCDKCIYKGAGFNEPLPCAKINGVTDAGLFGCLLTKGERSALFESGSQILEAYGKESIFFFYMNAGKEIARVEVPAWVARDQKAVDLVHAICLDQAEKGAGYPIAVAEAHEQAVVKSADKGMFDQLVSRALVKQGTPVVESRKALRKRGGFI
ncbi:MAG TPA: DNA double-strand break repair nuclease NurA [Anaerolineae bacterium]|nr:DNA double-strand break repair nuclease NurA [Anaerolineae bacterium]